MKKLVLAATLLTFGLSACATDPYTGQSKVGNTAKGAGIGAVAGAGIGLLTGKDAKQRKKNALVGAGIGLVAGGGVGVYMDKQETALRRELKASGVQIQKEGNNIRLIMPGNITFQSNSSTVASSFYPTLNAVAKVLKEYDDTLVTVVGYTDSTGSDSLNLKLSEDRARNVAGYLISQQTLKQDRFLVAGYGKSNPVASNATADGREQNRRVEITIEPITK